jgi:tetratricopeptide (TPR) repeat protein
MKKLMISLVLVLISAVGYSQTAKEYNKMGLSKAIHVDHTGAILDYNKAIAIDPNYALAYYNRGFSKSVLEDERGAILDYTKAIEINPNYIDAYYNRAWSKISLSQTESACLDFSKAGELGFKRAYEDIKTFCK